MQLGATLTHSTIRGDRFMDIIHGTLGCLIMVMDGAMDGVATPIGQVTIMDIITVIVMLYTIMTIITAIMADITSTHLEEATVQEPLQNRDKPQDPAVLKIIDYRVQRMAMRE